MSTTYDSVLLDFDEFIDIHQKQVKEGIDDAISVILALRAFDVLSPPFLAEFLADIGLADITDFEFNLALDFRYGRFCVAYETYCAYLDARNAALGCTRDDRVLTRYERVLTRALLADEYTAALNDLDDKLDALDDAPDDGTITQTADIAVCAAAQTAISALRTLRAFDAYDDALRAVPSIVAIVAAYRALASDV